MKDKGRHCCPSFVRSKTDLTSRTTWKPKTMYLVAISNAHLARQHRIDNNDDNKTQMDRQTERQRVTIHNKTEMIYLLKKVQKTLYVPHTAQTCDSPTYLTPDLCDEIPCTLSTSGAAA
jgi:hypothetical protein